MVISATDRRSVGQGVKTPPFHGGNTGSNPYGLWYVADGTLDEKKFKKSFKKVLTSESACDILI